MSETFDRTREREPLPKKDQIESINDLETLEAMKDEIDRRIARIETDLDFHDGTDDWEVRARGALSIHRYTEKIISRRIAALKQKDAPSKKAAKKRERLSCQDLTWRLMDGELDHLDGETVEEIEKVIDLLSEAIASLEMDQLDERSNTPRQDINWLMEAGLVLRSAKKKRHDLTLKAASIKREVKEAKRLAAEAVRERMFIEECRKMLPRETYLLLWDRVDRLCLETTTATTPD